MDAQTVVWIALIASNRCAAAPSSENADRIVALWMAASTSPDEMDSS